ncbi:efflux RND transporter permease subunit [Halorientalis salina]|uniref:efflux RND transporter permease subunit n=1 Tax=Halorientalis salina TaxID=2932266 RepID=UPI0010AD7BBA|nr:MMPL family transporter [Halorientalis salina]
MVEYQRVIDWVDDRIVNSPGKIVLLFLGLTVLFVGGLGNVETESGQDQFIDDLESFEALEDIQRDFGSSFSSGGSSASTTLLQDSQNVLSKPAMLRLLHAQQRVENQQDMRVESTSSPAGVVARTLDPNASTLGEEIDAVESATPSEIDAAVRRAAERNPGFTNQLSDDFNEQAASASAAQATISHGTGDIPDRDDRVRRVVGTVSQDVRVLGSQPDTISDSLVLVMPAALVLIVGFLIVAYRDLVDLLLGIVTIVIALLWTFGFLGLAGIAFNPLLVAVPPLLIAVGIDFGIHAVNRYREERARGQDIETSMRITTDQLLVAFFIVTGTTVIGFLSNLVSAFPPTKDFGLVAAIGIVFTFLLFGIFLPAGKVYIDRLRRKYPIPTMSQRPLGDEDSALGRALSGGVVVARRAPLAFLLVMLVVTGGVGYYATGIGTGFSPEDFMPAEETPEALQSLPEPFRPPASYQYVENYNFREEKFDQDGQVLLYVEGPMTRDNALESLHRAGADPPPTFRGDDRRADAQSIVTVIQSRAEADPEFRRLVARNDRNDDGIPDDNLGEIYDALLDSPAREQALSFISEDRRSARVVYTVDDSADDRETTADARAVASDHRFEASATGFAVIFQDATEMLFEGVVQSLALALVGASVFLVFIYWVLEGRPSLGIANVVPIAMSVAFVVASMRYLGVKFNAFNGTILAITIGLGIDYSVHVVHRFADEFDERPLMPALRRTIIGTGGALTGSMLTTVFGVGVLWLALNPAIGVFGILTALSVVYAYLASLFVLPSTLVLWDRVANRSTTGDPMAGGESSTSTPHESLTED